MSQENLRALVIYGKPQDELVEMIKNLPVGRSVQPGQGEHPIKLAYGQDTIHVAIHSDGTLMTANVLPQDLTPETAVPLSEDKLQLLANDLKAAGIDYSWELSDNDLKTLG